MSTYALRDCVVAAYRKGESTSVCPACGGGRSEERSFNVFELDDFTVGYKCHRASCGLSGRVLLAGEQRSHSRASHAPRRETLRIVPATKEDADAYVKQFGLLHPTVCVYGNERWFYTPLCRHDGSKYGWHRRIIDKTRLAPGQHKARTHKDEKYPLAFYRNSHYNRALIVVEDPWSALRVKNLPTLEMDTAAICGGDWTSTAAAEVKGKYRQVLLCLDRDAMAKAVTQAIKHQNLQPVRVIVPRVDLKNMEDDEIIRTVTAGR